MLDPITKDSDLTWFVSAGEPSGDLLGADLVKEMGDQMPHLKPVGICGPEMRAAGVAELVGIEDLSVMGFVEVIKHFPAIKRVEVNLISYLERHRPEFAVLVDYPGFHMRVAEALKALGIPVFQFVAPQLWAWGEKRTPKLKKVTDHVFGIVPFEEKFFRDRLVDYTYVGTPQVDRAEAAVDDRTKFKLQGDKTLFGFFPGSRVGEVKRVLPAMLNMWPTIMSALECEIVVSVAPSIKVGVFSEILASWEGADDIGSALESDGFWQSPDRPIRLIKGNSLDLMASVDVALVTSGTATLECGLTGTPLAVIYVANKVSYAIASRMVKLDFVSLVNLVAEEEVVKEYVQYFDCDEVASHLLALANDSELRKEKITKLKNLKNRLKGQPGRRTAKEIFRFLSHSPNVQIS